MSEPLIGELFAGYGGLGMAVQAVHGGKLAWYSEFDPAPSQIMAHHHPGVPNYGDVTAIDWDEIPRVDILTGGFPCQDVSVAGRRAGMTDGTRSGLWSHMAHAIDVLRPGLVVIENVGGLFSAEATSVVESHPLCLGDDGTGEHTVLLRAIDAVLSTLSELGYDAEWTALRASDVGAPHGRLRVFITAHPAEDTSGGGSGGRAALPLASGQGEPHSAPLGTDHRPGAPGSAPGLTLLPTPAAVRAGRQKSASAGAAIRPTLDSIHRLLPTPEAKLGSSGPDYARANRAGSGGDDLATTIALLPTPRATDGTKGGPNQRGSSGDLMLPSAVAQLLPTPMVGSTSPAAHGQISGDYRRRMDEALEQMPSALIPTPSVADATGGHERRGGARGDELLLKGLAKEGHLDRFGPYAPVIDRWERVLGRPAPDPTEPGRTRPRLASRFVEFLMGLDDGHVTGVGLTRNQELKALGNGVVVQQGAAALVHLERIRRENL